MANESDVSSQQERIARIWQFEFAREPIFQEQPAGQGGENSRQPPRVEPAEERPDEGQAEARG